MGAAKAGADAKECLVFEDSFQGLESGRRAGCRVIGLSTTNSAEAIEGKADMVVGSLGELVERVGELVG